MDTLERKKLLAELEITSSVLKKRRNLGSPLSYGYPDLLRDREPFEDEDTFRARRRSELKDLIQNKLYFVKDGKKIAVKVIDSMLDLIYDCFYREVSNAILWKPRGSGGSISVSIIIFLCMIYHKMSFTLIAGSGEQAKVVYKYVMGLWGCNTDMSNAMLAREPTQTKIQMIQEVGGAHLECITATEKASRGKHTAGLVIDEACLLPGTWIITKDGMKKIEDVVPGDYVWTHKGRFRKVLNTNSKLKTDFPCVTIKPKGGLPYTTTGDHRWMDEKGEWRRGWDWQVKDLSFYAKPTEKSTFNRPKWLESLQGWRFLGWHLGDGHTSKNDLYAVKFVSGKNEEHSINYINTVKSLFGVEVFTHEYEFHSGTIDYSFHPGRKIVDEIKSIAGKRALSKGISSDLILSASKEELYELLTGLIETDGCFSNAVSLTGGTNNRLSIRTSSDKLSANIVLISNILNLNVTIKRRKASKTAIIKGRNIVASDSWELVFSGSSFRKLIPYIDRDFKDLRKHDLKDTINQTETSWLSPIHSITNFNYTGLVYDIEVDEDTTFSSPYATFHNSQRDAHTDAAIQAAMQGPMSEPDHLIIACSTFHNTTGLYQELWDYAEEKGFTKYRWDVISCMSPCREKIDCKKCFLTEKVPVFDKLGNIIKIRYEGCAGRARKTTGWQSYDQVVTAKKQNMGTSVFQVEFMCTRPEFGRTVYSTKKLLEAEALCTKAMNGEQYVIYDVNNVEFSIGIDWGMTQTAVILTCRTPEYVGVLECKVFSHQSLMEIARYLQSLQRKYRPNCFVSKRDVEKQKDPIKSTNEVFVVNVGSFFDDSTPIPIYGDSSHPFNSMDLRQMGYVVYPVHFNEYKDYMIENVTKFLHVGRLQIPHIKSTGDFKILTKQLRLYMRDNKNKPVKKDDHCPDALALALFPFDYVNLFGDVDLAMGGIPKLNKGPSSVIV